MQRSAYLLTGAFAIPALRAHAESPPNAQSVLAEVGKVVSSNGIDEAKAVEIGGIQQWITVRGRDRRNPLLLVLHMIYAEEPGRVLVHLVQGALPFAATEGDQRSLTTQP